MKNYLSKNNSNEFGFFDKAFTDFFKPVFYGSDFGAMKTDIKETDDGYKMEIEMPGFSKEDISLDLKDGYLSISAEKSESSDESEKFIRRERKMSCSRSYYIGDVSEEDVKAKYANGVLSIAIPKEEAKKEIPKKIVIED